MKQLARGSRKHAIACGVILPLFALMVGASALPPSPVQASGAASIVPISMSAAAAQGDYPQTVSAMAAARSHALPLLTRPAAPPDAAGKMWAGKVSETSIEVQWEAFAITPDTYYQLQSNTGPKGSTVIIVVKDVKSTSYRYTDLVPNTVYAFAMRSCTTVSCSALTSDLTLRTLNAPLPTPTSTPTPTPTPLVIPQPPSNLHLQVGIIPGGVTPLCPPQRYCALLVWNDNSNNESNMVFEYSVAQIGVPLSSATWIASSLPANATGNLFQTATPGLLVSFRVKACNVAGCSAYSNIVQTTPH